MEKYLLPCAVLGAVIGFNAAGPDGSPVVCAVLGAVFCAIPLAAIAATLFGRDE